MLKHLFASKIEKDLIYYTLVHLVNIEPYMKVTLQRLAWLQYLTTMAEIYAQFRWDYPMFLVYGHHRHLWYESQIVLSRTTE